MTFEQGSKQLDVIFLYQARYNINQKYKKVDVIYLMPTRIVIIF